MIFYHNKKICSYNINRIKYHFIEIRIKIQQNNKLGNKINAKDKNIYHYLGYDV